MIQYVDNIDFDYTYYQENILLTGIISSGKTWKAKEILSLIPNARRWVWDESSNFHEFGQVINSLDKLKEGNFVLDLYDKSKTNFEKYTNYLYQNALSYRLTNLVNVIDEVQKFTNPHDYDSDLFRIVTSMRNRGISNIFICPYPNMLPKWIKDNTFHFFGFRTNDYDQLEYMQKNFFGKESWLLTTKDKRKYLQEEIELPTHSFIYRDIRKSETQVFVND